MSSPEYQELQQQVDDLIAATRRGSFEWKPVNPTTYVWEKPPTTNTHGARMTLQRTEHLGIEHQPGRPPVQVTKQNCILQIYELLLPLGQPMLKLTIEGSKNREVNQLLVRLFDLITSGIKEEGLDFFKSLIKKEQAARSPG